MNIFNNNDKEYFEKYFSGLNNEIKNLKNEINSLKEENNELKRNIHDLKRYYLEKDSILNDLEEKNSSLKNELDMYKVECENYQDSNNFLFNCLFLDCDLKVKGVRKNLQDLSLELLNFVVAVCDKNNLDYWLDFGTLLGARRHENFITFDDDVDISMPRKDYNTLLDILDDEFKKKGLDDCVKVRHDFFTEFSQITFTQIVYFSHNKKLIGAIDIFPYDFISNNTIENMDYSYEREVFRRGIFENPGNRSILEENFMANLNLSYEKEKYMILGVDAPLSNLMIFETEKIYPQCTLKFADKRYKAPKNPYAHLKKLYGNWKLIPSKVHYHNRLNNLRNNKQLENEYKYELKRIRSIVKSFSE